MLTEDLIIPASLLAPSLVNCIPGINLPGYNVPGTMYLVSMYLVINVPGNNVPDSNVPGKSMSLDVLLQSNTLHVTNCTVPWTCL